MVEQDDNEVSFAHYRRLIIATFERQDKQIEKIQSDIASMKEHIAKQMGEMNTKLATLRMQVLAICGVAVTIGTVLVETIVRTWLH